MNVSNRYAYVIPKLTLKTNTALRDTYTLVLGMDETAYLNLYINIIAKCELVNYRKALALVCTVFLHRGLTSLTLELSAERIPPTHRAPSMRPLLFLLFCRGQYSAGLLLELERYIDTFLS